jgi:hypothetical protein
MHCNSCYQNGLLLVKLNPFRLEKKIVLRIVDLNLVLRNADFRVARIGDVRCGKLKALGLVLDHHVADTEHIVVVFARKLDPVGGHLYGARVDDGGTDQYGLFFSFGYDAFHPPRGEGYGVLVLSA